MKTANELLHEIIREQKRALNDLVRNIREDIPEENMGKHFRMALEDAEILCQILFEEVAREDDA